MGKTVSEDGRIINIHGHLKDESSESNFIPGMFIDSEIFTDEINGFALPSNSIVDIEGDYFALVLNSLENNKYTFAKRSVKVGRTTNGFTQILNSEEFSKEDKFVIEGAFNLIQ